MKEIVILAGPNGAGKTTSARLLLREFLDSNLLVNADEIARQITSPNRDLAAGRLMLRHISELVASGTSFAVETTLSGRSYVHLLQRCVAENWRISLMFLWLPSPEFAIERVETRVKNGGHAIPPDVIRRRFYAGLENLRELYLPLASEARIYDNSAERAILIAEKSGRNFAIHDPVRWKAMLGAGS
jgi:predicted ABC-type ATPase